MVKLLHRGPICPLHVRNKFNKHAVTELPVEIELIVFGRRMFPYSGVFFHFNVQIRYYVKLCKNLFPLQVILPGPEYVMDTVKCYFMPISYIPEMHGHVNVFIGYLHFLILALFYFEMFLSLCNTALTSR